MSIFSEISADANEVHDDWFGDAWEYRASSEEEWTPIIARKYNERFENRKTEHGWKRVKVFELAITSTEIEQLIMHSNVRVADADELATVTEFVRITSGRWQATCQNVRAGEISRPNLRRL
jgi:hypothetical protein